MVPKSAPRHPAWMVLAAGFFGFAVTTVWAGALFMQGASLPWQLLAVGASVWTGFTLVRECVFVFRRSGPWSRDTPAADGR